MLGAHKKTPPGCPGGVLSFNHQLACASVRLERVLNTNSVNCVICVSTNDIVVV